MVNPHTASRATGHTPFKLLFGDEAVTPEEVRLASLCISSPPSDEDREVALDGTDATREQATLLIERYQASMAKAYNKTVRECPIKVGDLVLKRKANPEADDKLSSKWEGPYEVINSSRPSSFHLRSLDVVTLKHSWNADNLRKYYV